MTTALLSQYPYHLVHYYKIYIMILPVLYSRGEIGKSILQLVLSFTIITNNYFILWDKFMSLKFGLKIKIFHPNLFMLAITSATYWTSLYIFIQL